MQSVLARVCHCRANHVQEGGPHASHCPLLAVAVIKYLAQQLVPILFLLGGGVKTVEATILAAGRASLLF